MPESGFIHRDFETLLVCPACSQKIFYNASKYNCANSDCNQCFPVVNEMPVLISDAVSTFSSTLYLDERKKSVKRGWKSRLRSLVPRISANYVARKNFEEFSRLLRIENLSPLVVVLGGAEVGAGMEALLGDANLKILESDVVVGPRTQIVFDASHIPLETESVDGIVIQAVLEYIPDPAQAVAEIYRVLKPKGIVYSEMPFMQDVHGGRYDFTRLTHLGHLRLYRRFSEIKSGACGGPGTALAWTLQHFFLSFVRTPWQRDLTKIGTGLSFFWLKYFDHFLAGTPGGLDGASGTYLLARKSEFSLSDRQLIACYRGAVPAGKIL
jgi:SAM-dependent methyltransferase